MKQPMKQLVYDLFAEKHRGAAIAQIRALEQKLPSAGARFAIPFVFRGQGYFRTIQPRQNPVEIESLFKSVCALHPRRVLEVGTARGGSLYLWIQAATPDATIVSVDLPGGDFGGAYPAPRVPFYEAFRRPEQHLTLFRLDSHDSQTHEQVRQVFEGQPLDFAFIDGDHTYVGVKADFEDYGPMVRAGGLIAFHDILPRPDLPSIQVDRLWAELKDRYDTEEFIGPDGSGRRIGIGLLRVPEGGISPGPNPPPT